MEIDRQMEIQGQIQEVVKPASSVNIVYKEIRLKISSCHDIVEERTLKLIEQLLEKSVQVEKIRVEHRKPGYRFVPKDEELILDYLKKKIRNDSTMNDEIQEVNLYQHNPQYFSEQYDSFENEWYFFTPRDRKYLRGNRPNRTAGTGYWKATGADKKINYKGEIIGFRKVLVFYDGKPPKGDKTCWIMHEYRVNQPARVRKSSNDMRLDDYVLCRIYKKVNRISKNDKLLAQLVHESSENSQESDVSIENITMDHVDGGGKVCDETTIMNHGRGMVRMGVKHPSELINIVGNHSMTPSFQNVLPQVSSFMDINRFQNLIFHGDGSYNIHQPSPLSHPMKGILENMHLNQGIVNLKAKETEGILENIYLNQGPSMSLKANEDANDDIWEQLKDIEYLNSTKLSPLQFSLDNYFFSNPFSTDVLSYSPEF